MYNRQSKTLIIPFSFALGGSNRGGFIFYIMKHIPKENFFDSVQNPFAQIKKPKQYQIGIDTFERAEANLTKEEILAICKFNIDKYCWRQKDQDKEDFQKIIKYAEWALKNL